MALTVTTTRPRALLRKIYEAIAGGIVTTWMCDADGDFTHTSPQWGSRLWLRPETTDGKLHLTTIPRQGQRISVVTYAYYHGHFTQMLLTHFDEDFNEVSASAQAGYGDKIGR